MSDAKTIVAKARRGNRVVGWRLPTPDRRLLLERFEPRYKHIVADHVTLSVNVATGTTLPEPVDAQVVGHADDGQGVEALVVAIEGSTDRPGGGIYHMTWSLEPGRTAKESNDVLVRKGWTALAETVPVKLSPAFLR